MVSENVPTPALAAPLSTARRCCQACCDAAAAAGSSCVQYTGAKGQIPRYACVRGRLDYGEPSCIAFGGTARR